MIFAAYNTDIRNHQVCVSVDFIISPKTTITQQ